MKKRRFPILLAVFFSIATSSILGKPSCFAMERTIAGKNGWIFYTAAGDGSTIYDYKGINHYSPMGLERAANNLLAAEKAVKQRGAGFIIYIAPNKETIYSQYMPESIKRKTTYTRADQLIDYLDANTSLNVGYPKDELLEKKNDYELYYPNDTHWNKKGQFIGVQELMDLTDGKKVSLDDVKFRMKKSHYGDLCRLSNGKYNFLCKQFMFASKVKAKDKSNKKIFIVGDSFGNAMTGIAKRYYKSVRFCHINNFHISMVREGETVIWEAVERYQDKFTHINFSVK